MGKPKPWLELAGAKGEGIKFGMITNFIHDHLRKGEVGDWRTHFEPYPELLDAFEAAFAREMRGCAGRRWDCGGGKVMTLCTDTRQVKGK